jgi:hypothetical protein
MQKLGSVISSTAFEKVRWKRLDGFSRVLPPLERVQELCEFYGELSEGEERAFQCQWNWKKNWAGEQELRMLVDAVSAVAGAEMSDEVSFEISAEDGGIIGPLTIGHRPMQVDNGFHMKWTFTPHSHSLSFSLRVSNEDTRLPSGWKKLIELFLELTSCLELGGGWNQSANTAVYDRSVAGEVAAGEFGLNGGVAFGSLSVEIPHNSNQRRQQLFRSIHSVLALFGAFSFPPRPLSIFCSLSTPTVDRLSSFHSVLSSFLSIDEEAFRISCDFPRSSPPQETALQQLLPLLDSYYLSIALIPGQDPHEEGELVAYKADPVSPVMLGANTVSSATKELIAATLVPPSPLPVASA